MLIYFLNPDAINLNIYIPAARYIGWKASAYRQRVPISM